MVAISRHLFSNKLVWIYSLHRKISIVFNQPPPTKAAIHPVKTHTHTKKVHRLNESQQVCKQCVFVFFLSAGINSLGAIKLSRVNIYTTIIVVLESSSTENLISALHAETWRERDFKSVPNTCWCSLHPFSISPRRTTHKLAELTEWMSGECPQDSHCALSHIDTPAAWSPVNAAKFFLKTKTFFLSFSPFFGLSSKQRSFFGLQEHRRHVLHGTHGVLKPKLSSSQECRPAFCQPPSRSWTLDSKQRQSAPVAVPLAKNNCTKLLPRGSEERGRGQLEAVGACLHGLRAGFPLPLSPGQQCLLLIISQCSSVSQLLIRIYRARASRGKMEESQTD